MHDEGINDYPTIDGSERSTTSTNGSRCHRENASAGIGEGNGNASERTFIDAIPSCEICSRNELITCVTNERWERAVKSEWELIALYTELAEIAAALDVALEELPVIKKEALGDLPVDSILWACSSHLHDLVRQRKKIETGL